MNISDINNDGIALDGFDPVAHYNNEPLRGKPEFQYTLRDETYYFANEANLKTFQNDPAKYFSRLGAIVQNNTGVGNGAPASHASGPEADEKRTTFNYRSGLEDVRETLETNETLVVEPMRDGSVEMQNLSDDNN